MKIDEKIMKRLVAFFLLAGMVVPTGLMASGGEKQINSILDVDKNTKVELEYVKLLQGSSLLQGICKNMPDPKDLPNRGKMIPYLIYKNLPISLLLLSPAVISEYIRREANSRRKERSRKATCLLGDRVPMDSMLKGLTVASVGASAGNLIFGGKGALIGGGIGAAIGLAHTGLATVARMANKKIEEKIEEKENEKLEDDDDGEDDDEADV